MQQFSFPKKKTKKKKTAGVCHTFPYSCRKHSRHYCRLYSLQGTVTSVMGHVKSLLCLQWHKCWFCNVMSGQCMALLLGAAQTHKSLFPKQFSTVWGIGLLYFCILLLYTCASLSSFSTDLILMFGRLLCNLIMWYEQEQQNKLRWGSHQSSTGWISLQLSLGKVLSTFVNNGCVKDFKWIFHLKFKPWSQLHTEYPPLWRDQQICLFGCSKFSKDCTISKHSEYTNPTVTLQTGSGKHIATMQRKHNSPIHLQSGNVMQQLPGPP